MMDTNLFCKYLIKHGNNIILLVIKMTIQMLIKRRIKKLWSLPLWTSKGSVSTDYPDEGWRVSEISLVSDVNTDPKTRIIKLPGVRLMSIHKEKFLNRKDGEYLKKKLVMFRSIQEKK